MLTDKESLKRRKNLERLNTVVHYIEENYTDSISNAQLAELIHVSEDRFNHLFRESMGMAPLQYMNEVRLKKAMHLLKSGNYSAAEVADRAQKQFGGCGRIFGLQSFRKIVPAVLSMYTDGSGAGIRGQECKASG